MTRPRRRTTRPRRSRRRHRPGTVYVIVLGLSALLATIALGAVATVRARNRAAALDDAAADARNYALSAIDLGRREVATNAAWRSAHKNDPDNQWLAGVAIDRGTMSLTVVNPSGALDRADTDSVVLTGAGARGGARQMVRVTLAATTTPFTCLDSAAFAANGMSLGSATIAGAGVISSNGAVTATNAKVTADVESALAVAGVADGGATRSPVAARTCPNATLFDFYKANGTTLAYASFPSVQTGRGISQNLLTPTYNPFGGGTNASGIYVVDCGGQDFFIKASRIVGTLVLLNAGPNTGIQTNLNWAPAVANYPCLLVQGPLSLGFTAADLSEGTVKVNLNPAGSPYPWSGGTTDADQTDSYPSTIDGLVYASGDVSTNGAPSVDQLICGGTLNTVGKLTLNYVSTFQTSPPPGFYSVKMAPSPGSWQPYAN